MLSFWKRILIAMATVIGVLFLITSFGIGIFYLRQDQIKTRIVNQLNEAQEGEVYIHRIEITPFEYLPYMALTLDSVSYFEKKSELRAPGTKPIIAIKTIITGVQYEDMFNGIFKPAGLILEHGEINLVTYTDSSFNILNALGLHRSEPNLKEEAPTAVFGAEKEGPLGELDIVEFLDIEVVNRNLLKNEEVKIYLKAVTSHVTEDGKIAHVHNHGDISLDHFKVGTKNLINQKHLKLDLEYDFDMETLDGVFTQGLIDLHTAELNIGGTFNLKLPVRYDISFEVLKTGLGVINLDDPQTYLQDEGNGSGKIHLKGFVRGSSSDPVPYAEVKFEAENIDLDDPKTDSYVKGFQVDGYFSTGTEADLSEAELKIENLKANVSGDNLTAHINIRNFKHPKVVMDIDARIQLQGLDRDLGLDFLSDLDGVVRLHADVDGTINLEQGDILHDIGAVQLELDDVSFLIPATNQRIEEVNARIQMKEGILNIEQVSVRSGPSDLSVTGHISNLIAALAGEKKGINGTFNIKSAKLDFSKALAFYSDIEEGSYLDEVLQDLDATIRLETHSEYFDEENELPVGKVVLEAFSAKLQNRPDITNLEGTIYVATTRDHTLLGHTNFEDYYGVEGLRFQWGTSDLELNGKLTHLVDLNNLGHSPVEGDISFRSNKLAIAELLSFDPTLAQAYDETITGLTAEIKLQTSVDKILSQRGLPMGIIELKNFTADFQNRADLKKMTGVIYIGEDSLGIRDFEGQLGNSQIKFSHKIRNYNGLWQADTLKTIQVEFHYESSLLEADDLFKYKDRFYLPERMRGETLKDFILEGHFEISNLDLLGVNPLPDLKLTVDRINWVTKRDLHYKDLNIIIERQDRDLHLHRLAGQIGESDFVISAHWKGFEPFLDPQLSDFSATFNVDAGRLNLNQLLAIQLPKRDQPRRKIEPLQYFYDDIEFNLDVEDLTFKDFRVYQLEGQLRTERSRKVHLRDFNFKTASGSVHMIADLDTSNPLDINLTGDIVIDAVELDQAFVPLKHNEEQLDFSKYFKGTFSSHIQANLFLDQDLTIDMARSSAEIDFSLKEGGIENYQPVMELSKYLGDRDLEHVRFAEIKNKIELNDGLLTVPRMDVRSTLGQLFLEGTWDLDGNIQYIVEVPWRLVRRAAWTSLTHRAREEGAPEDEIQEATNKPYVALRIEGNDQEEIQVKLGRGKEARKIKKQEKKEARKPT